MFRALLLFLALLTLPAATVVVEHARGPSYTGPLDIVSGATAFYSLRAGSGAIAAAGTQNLVNIRRASDNVACDFLVASSGGFGVTTATCNSSTQGGVSYGTFVGSDGTASCTLAGTTGACTGATGTVHTNDVVTGTGLTQPCVVAAASNTAPTIEIAGTTTSCGTIGVAETFTFQVAGFVTEAYDQTGNGFNLIQATAGLQPQFIPNCNGSLPCIYANGGLTLLQSVAFGTYAVPYTFSHVAIRMNSFTNFGDVSSVGSNPQTGFGSNVNSALLYSGSVVNVSGAADQVWHAIQYVYNGASSVVNIDGTDNTGLSPGSAALTGGEVSWCSGIGNSMAGYCEEYILYHSAITLTQRNNLHTNQKYWNTP
jgi:hypothetical protein